MLIVQLSGCATIAHRSGETIQIDTDPDGADAVVECNRGVRVASKTPARLVIPRKATGCVLSLTREGSVAQTIPLKRGISGKFWAEFWIAAPAAVVAASADDSLENISLVVVFGTVALIAAAGALVDMATGRLWAHEPDAVEVKMEPAP
ncbi:MAG TPA: hypothetical protein VFT12_04145 [Thermoanaerobaculia bacterium]|nr:hypothetical protein [Thermoanaerobaculia bacterium]